TRYNTFMPVYKKVDKNFFKKWSAEMAYVLGFFAADGYITLNKRGANFWCIQITDKALLQSIKKAVQAEHKISVRARVANQKPLYRLQIGSKEMCNDLRLLGFAERKTNNMTIPHIPAHFFSHFVRGYFDGDGNVWSGHVHKDRKKPSRMLMTMFTSGSARFLQELHGRLRLSVVQGGYIYTAKQGYSRLQFATGDSLKLYDFMYNQQDPLPRGLFLKRKKKVFEKYVAAVAQR
ncbi:MAG: LAGLIDADG family homing endonuclease, partial [Candidatus Paceibacterota bacterium]